MRSVECMLMDVVVTDLTPAVAEEYDAEAMQGGAFEMMSKPAALYGKCVVALYGVDADGRSVCVRVRGFEPSVVFPREHLRTAPGTPSTVRPFHAARMDGWDPDPATRSAKVHALARVHYDSCFAFRRASKMPHALEGSIDLSTQFLDTTGLRACGWFRASGGVGGKATHCAVEIDCEAGDLRALPERVDIAPLKIASFDIECVSESGDFPNKPELNDRVSCVGVHLWTHGVADSDRYVCFTVGRCDPFDIEGVAADVRAFDTERGMLRALRDFWAVEANVDVRLSHNGAGFDDPFLWKRARRVGADTFPFLSREALRPCREPQEKEISSNQSGARKVFLIEAAGRGHVDTQFWFMKNRKCQSYSLSAVAEEFLGSDKIHLGDAAQTDDYKALRAKILGGDPRDMAEVNKYCLWDCVLPSKLTRQEQILEGFVTTARTTHTVFQQLVFGGETRKNANMFVHYAHRTTPAPYVLAPIKSTDKSLEGKYTGATVLEAKVGFYKDPVSTLDFASLYPSIMQTCNLCPSTLVARADLRAEILALTPPAQSFAFLVVDGTGACRVLDDRCELHAAPGEASKCLRAQVFLVLFLETPVIFVQTQPGVTPSVLTTLLHERKAVRKQKAAEPDPVKAAVLEALQKAIKVSANSVYGAFGAEFGDMSCKEIAAATTFLGRWMIERTKERAEELTQAPGSVIYGDTDSVFVLQRGKSVAEAEDVGDRIAERITAHFASFSARLKQLDDRVPKCYIDLENEKTYCPFNLLAKKRYIGRMSGNGKIDAKGVAESRRDYAPVTTKLYKEVRTILMARVADDPREAALAALRAGVARVVDDEVPLQDYVKNKKLNNTSTRDLAHWHAADELAERGFETPHVGDRQDFIYVVKPGKTPKAFERAKDPRLVRADGDAVHRVYYLTNELQSPLTDLLKSFGNEAVEVFASAKRRLEASLPWLQSTGEARLLSRMQAEKRPAPDLRSLSAPIPVPKRNKKPAAKRS